MLEIADELAKVLAYIPAISIFVVFWNYSIIFYFRRLVCSVKRVRKSHSQS